MMERTTWGGKRAGAGRKATSPFVPHASRPPIEGKALPVEIRLRVRRSAPSLRSRAMLQTFRKASLRARRFGLRIIEYRLCRREAHLICEFANRRQLASSFKSLNTTIAIALKRRLEKKRKLPHRGPVFLDRYRLGVLESPMKLKLALKRLLTADTFGTMDWTPFCSALNFRRWRFLEPGRKLERPPAPPGRGLKLVNEIQASPRFWLTREGWIEA